MIISHKYKFIFIKTTKTAGTSIELYLSQFCAENDICTPISNELLPPIAKNYKGFVNPIPEIVESRGRGYKWLLFYAFKYERYFEHIYAASIKRRIGDSIWNSYYKFCIERNPWDKTLSHFYMLKYRNNKRLSFDEYLAKGKYPHNLPFYTSIGGTLMIDEIIRYESLNKGLNEVFERLSIPFNDSLNIRAKSGYRSDNRPYQEIYNTQQRKIVESAFKNEIELHGYEF